MISIEQQLKKLANKLFKKRVDSFHRDPYGDWKKIVLVASIVSFIIILFAGYFFSKLNRGELFTTESNDVHMSEIFDKKLLTADNEYYTKREMKMAELMASSTVPVVDPSI